VPEDQGKSNQKPIHITRRAETERQARGITGEEREAHRPRFQGGTSYQLLLRNLVQEELEREAEPGNGKPTGKTTVIEG